MMRGYWDAHSDRDFEDPDGLCETPRDFAGAPAQYKLIIGECECCGAPNRVLHPTTAYGMDASPCSLCRGNPLSDDIADLQDEIDRRYAAGNWDHAMELHAALIEAMASAICKALAA